MGAYLSVVLRGDGKWTNELPTNGYEVQIPNTPGYIILNRVSNGVRNTLGVAAFTPTIDQDYQIKVQVNGTTIRFRIWEDGQSEPGTWDISVTDSTITSGILQLGWIGEQDSAQNVFIDNVDAHDISTVVTGSASISGTGAVTVAGIGVSSGTAAIAGTGSQTISALAVVPGASQIQGAGAVAAVGYAVAPGAANITGSGAVSAQATATALAVANIAGTGAVVVDGAATAFAVANIAGAGAATIVGLAITDGVAAVAGVGAVAIQGYGWPFVDNYTGSNDDPWNVKLWVAEAA